MRLRMEINLKDYGWDDFFADAKKSSSNNYLEHGRIVSVHKSRYEVITTEGAFSCEILGNLQFQKNPLLLPAVGDWVLLDRYQDTRIVHQVLDRKSLIKRQKKHDNFPKPIAANIDRAIVVQAIGTDFNIKRLERILVHVYEAGVIPIVVINKIDLAPQEVLLVAEELKSLNQDITLIFTSYKTGKGIDTLEKTLTPGETVIFIGSSGVGKSSIINSMLGQPLQETNTITESTGKGRHTTTARRLIRLNNGVLVIDTPGTREFGMHSDDNVGIKQSFEYIESIALECKFSNCNHDNEPGCSIQQALAIGDIDRESYERYRVLQHELIQSAKQMRQASKKSSRPKNPQPLRSVRPGKVKKKK
jgi:ribosome biogenesis GTPase